MPRSPIPEQTRRLVSLAEATSYAGVTGETLRHWIASGIIPGYRLGPKLLRVDLNELDAALCPLQTVEGKSVA